MRLWYHACVCREGILTYPDNYLVNNIHSPYFCGSPFFPYIVDATNGTGPANLPDQLITAGVTWAYYAQDWYNEEADANSSVTDTCKKIGNDKKLSANVGDSCQPNRRQSKTDEHEQRQCRLLLTYRCCPPVPFSCARVRVNRWRPSLTTTASTRHSRPLTRSSISRTSMPTSGPRWPTMHCHPSAGCSRTRGQSTHSQEPPSPPAL